MLTSRFYETFESLLRRILTLGCFLALTPLAQAETYWVYFGTYTTRASKGIYVSRFDSHTGVLQPVELAAESKDPSFLVIHPSGRFVYAVNETSDYQGKSSGSVSAFERDPRTGHLTLLNVQPSGGAAPCHINLDQSGKYVLVANYMGGSVASLPIDKQGALGPIACFVQHTGKGPNPARQEGPHAHSIYVDAANRYAIAADLGLDKLLVYAFDAKSGFLTANSAALAQLAPGSGPRHFAFHPNGRLGFAINEMASTVTTLEYNPKTGALKALGSVSTLPKDFKGNSTTAEVFLHPSGRFLYGSNRGHDSIAVFRVDRSNGALTWVQNQPIGGKTPRGFGIDPSGRWLLAGNQDSDQVTVFRIDPSTGALEDTHQHVAVGAPVSVHFLKAR